MSDRIVQALNAIAVELSILNKTLAERKQPEPAEPVRVATQTDEERIISTLHVELENHRIQVVGLTLKSGADIGYQAHTKLAWDVSKLNLSVEFFRKHLGNGWYHVSEVQQKLLQIANIDVVASTMRKLTRSNEL